LIVENGYSLVKINKAAYEPFKLALWELVKYLFNWSYLSHALVLCKQGIIDSLDAVNS